MLMAEERRLNSELDLSFQYQWEGNGYWGNKNHKPIDFDYQPKKLI
jgi:hypothetical protein